MYRIAIYPRSTGLCDTICGLAARFNGGENTLTLKQLHSVAESQVILYPSMNDGCKAELIGNDLLHIDRTIGNETLTILSIQEVEIIELDMPEELSC